MNRERLQTVKIDRSFRGSSHDCFFFSPLNSKVYLILLAGLVKTLKNEFRVIQLNRLSHSMGDWYRRCAQ